jgi:hypothetical protein
MRLLGWGWGNVYLFVSSDDIILLLRMKTDFIMDVELV